MPSHFARHHRAGTAVAGSSLSACRGVSPCGGAHVSSWKACGPSFARGLAASGFFFN